MNLKKAAINVGLFLIAVALTVAIVGGMAWLVVDAATPKV